MGKSTRETLYPETRLSAPLTARGVGSDATEPPLPDYPMIEALRAAREHGYDAITAAERYDPDFSLDLSRCQTAKEADAMLERWYKHRAAILDETRASLREIWKTHRLGDKTGD